MSTLPIIATGATGQRQWVSAFLKVAVAKKYPASVTGLAMALIELHFNRKTGQCNPGYAMLAAELGCDERTIKRAAKRLEIDGWIKRSRAPGQYEKVEFTLTIPAQSEVTAVVTPERAPEVTQNGTMGDNCCHPFNEEHLNTGNRGPQFRSRPGPQVLARFEAESRAANERLRKLRGSSVGITAASS